MKRVLMVLVAGLLLAGCIVPQLTLAEKEEAVAIRARYEAGIEAGKVAAEALKAAKAKVEEMGYGVKKAADEMKALYLAMKEDGVDIPAILAELEVLKTAKAALEKLADEAAAEALRAKAQGELAAGEAVGATRDAKALEDRVKQRIEAEGEKANRLFTWLAVILGVATGGAGLKVGSKVAGALATYQKVKTAFSVLSKATGTEPDGRAPADVRARINVGLAGVDLSDVELEALRKAAQ